MNIVLWVSLSSCLLFGMLTSFLNFGLASVCLQGYSGRVPNLASLTLKCRGPLKAVHRGDPVFMFGILVLEQCLFGAILV